MEKKSQRSQPEALDLLFAKRASAAIFCRVSSDLASKCRRGLQLHRSNFSTVSLVTAEIFQILALLYKLLVAGFYATIPKTVAHLSFSKFTLDSSKARATKLRKNSRIYFIMNLLYGSWYPGWAPRLDLHLPNIGK